MTIITAHQPSYLPWIGLFHKIDQSETFVVFDGVQYTKKDFVSRNWIKTQNGPLLLTVPVESKNHFQTLLKDARIADHHWERKHFRAIELAYQKAPFFKGYKDPLEEIILGNKYEFLADLNFDILSYLLDSFGINVEIICASEYSFQGTKSDLVLDMCKQLKASEYIFGGMGKDYADVQSFTKAGIKARFQEFNHPTYPQLHGDFIPNMSAIDLLFNMGPASLEIIRGTSNVR